MATQVRPTPAGAGPIVMRRAHETTRARLREQRLLARIPVLGQIGRVLTVLGMVILIGTFVAALGAEWTMGWLTFLGGFLALLGSTLWLTPNMGPDRGGRRRRDAASTLRRMTLHNWLLWGVTLLVSALGGLFFALWYDWLALLG